MTSQDPEPEDAEVVDGLPVLAADAQPASPPAEVAARPGGALAVAGSRQVAALAATGFAAGAATVALVHRHRSKSLAKQLRRRKGRPTALGEVLGSNSFLVDVHLLRRD